MNDHIVYEYFFLLFFPSCWPVGTSIFLALLQYLGRPVMSVRCVESGHNFALFPVVGGEQIHVFIFQL